MKIFNLTVVIATMTVSPLFAQQHIPSILPPEGQTAVIDAQVVRITPAATYLVSGWYMDNQNLNFGTATTPIRLVLEYDILYTIEMQGFAQSDADPNRLEVTETITIPAPVMTQPEEIRHFHKMRVISESYFLDGYTSGTIGHTQVTDALNNEDVP